MGSEAGLVEKVHVVLNRVGCDFHDGAIGKKKAEETITKPVYWEIPNDAKAMMGSRNAGVPLLQYAPRSKVHQSIVGLGQRLCGEEVVVEPKRGISGIFSFR